MDQALSPQRAGVAPLALLAVAVITSGLIWWLVALPILNGVGARAHGPHYLQVFAHAAGGTLMLFIGALALYIGLTRRMFGVHKWVGGLYLAGGALGAGTGLYLSAANYHPLPGVGLATGALAAAWLFVATMAWRAARSRQFDSHRAWMIRSFVLTWTFVFCRMVMRLPFAAEAGPDVIVGIIWATWIGPLVVCEIALRLSDHARRTAA
jgi:hypothetical protein